MLQRKKRTPPSRKAAPEPQDLNDPSNVSSKPRKCPKCNTVLSSSQIDGLCPDCVAKVTLGLQRTEKPKPLNPVKEKDVEFP
jgi:hypothetical protein